jgi:hypothetical protein
MGKTHVAVFGGGYTKQGNPATRPIPSNLIRLHCLPLPQYKLLMRQDTSGTRKFHNGNAQGQRMHTIIRIDIHTISTNATGLLGGVRGDLTFVFERDVVDVRFVRERERGFSTGLL